MSESKEPIRLRQRKMTTWNISLYLDIYLNGKRTYEYLKMYLIPEQTRADREKNKETLKLADAVRAKRVIELRNGQYGFKNTTFGKLRFFDYYRELCEKRLGEERRGNYLVESSPRYRGVQTRGGGQGWHAEDSQASSAIKCSSLKETSSITIKLS